MRVGWAGGCSGGLSGGNAAGSGGSQAAGGTGAGVTGARLTGSVRGGQQPIVGRACVSAGGERDGIWRGGDCGFDEQRVGVAADEWTGTTLDTSGGATNGDYYVTTDAEWELLDHGRLHVYGGAAGYLYALGGNPGSGVNSAAGLMAALGNCPAAGNFLGTTAVSL